MKHLTRIASLLLLGLLQTNEVWASRPNVLLILTDDQSCTTLSCYYQRIPFTPNIDRLAAGGTRFTAAYATSQCTPTRAALLTGQYTARNKMWHVIGWYGCPWARMQELPFREQLPRSQPTVASELRKAGYTTGIFGKWHLTNNADGTYRALQPDHCQNYGFDFAPPPLANEEFEEGGDRGVTTLTQQSIQFIKENRDRPWFCFLSHHMIHGKVVAPKHLVEKYREMGYGDEGPNRAVYLAGIEAIDRSVGTLLSSLEEFGELDETIIIFLSDNGGIEERLEHRSLNKPHPAAPQLIPNLREFSNTPLRAGKGSIYEGGVRVPLIMHWPGKIAAGKVIDTPVHVIDIAPTLHKVAKHEPDPSNPIDGIDLYQNLLLGEEEKLLANRPIFQYCPFYDLNWGLTPCASVRRGKFKLIEFFGDRFNRDNKYVAGYHVELYDLELDPGETRNLAKLAQGTKKELLDLLHAWMKEHNVKASPPNPHFDPTRAFETTNKKPQWLTDSVSE